VPRFLRQRSAQRQRARLCRSRRPAHPYSNSLSLTVAAACAAAVMLRQLARTTLRRGLATAAPQAPRSAPSARARTTAGLAGLALAGFGTGSIYFAWSLQQRKVASDAPEGVPCPRDERAVADGARAASTSTHPLSAETASSKDALASAASEHTHDDAHPLSPSSSPSGDTAAASSPAADGETTSAGQGGAYNPETGEINWDCPCLGGMAHGPCGPQFREAFSCFIYSEAEPKGIECVERFKGMQDCFREHPEVYAEGELSLPGLCVRHAHGPAEIMDDDDEEVADAPATLETPATTPENTPVPTPMPAAPAESDAVPSSSS
jgi:intermembrane space import and assembly protein 40